MVAALTQSIEVFISYAREDHELKKELEKHLESLLRTGLINVWSDDQLRPGVDQTEEIEEHINSAQIALILVSPDYMASKYLNFETQQIMNKFNSGLVQVIPILLRPTELGGDPFGNSTILPTNGNPVMNWTNRDNAFLDITKSIRGQIEVIINQKQFQTPFPSGTNKLAQSIIRQGKLEKGAIEKNATADIPVQSLSEDKLGFDVYVRALRDFIASQETSTPLTIGIHGPWGSGKSSLMQMLQKQLNPPLNIWKRLQLSWSRLVWLFLFFLTLPVWTFGQILLWSGSRLGSTQHNWIKQLNKDLNYDPSNPSTYSINASQGPQQHLRFWQQIALHQYPNDPPTHPTIWFNAWKFDQEEQLWAALALEVLDQIKQRYNFLVRIIFWLTLSFKRFSLLSFLKAVALPLLFGLIYWIYTSYAKLLPNIFVRAFGSQIPLGQLLLWIGLFVSTLIQILKIAKDPFQIDVKNVFDKPNYKDKVGFIGNFDKDFSRIVSLITRPRLGWKPRKLVIFIDDLDRCEAPKAADVIEGINLFLDAKGCVFVLGMDTNAVVASIENKYKELFQKLRQENTEMVSPGRSFLDKIIQVPFQVPPSTDEGIGKFVKAITQPKDSLAQYQQGPTTKIRPGMVGTQTQQTAGGSGPTPLAAKATLPDPASYKLDDVVNAINEGAQYLPENPRQVKRFINLFRLYVYIVDARGLLISREDGTDKQKVGLNLKRLAIWVIWSMQWGEIVKSLYEEKKLSREDLRIYLLKISNSIQDNGNWALSPNGAIDWNHYDRLLEMAAMKKEKEANSPSHWSHLPWKIWLLDRNFLISIKEMEFFLQLPQPNSNEEDWLYILLTMNRAAISPNINTPSDNVNAASKKTIKLSDSN